MGSFIGHALPGSFFIGIGLWWFLHVLIDYVNSLNEQPNNRAQHLNQGSWRRTKRFKNIPFEPLLKVFCALVGICAEFGPQHFHLVDENNHFINPNRIAHSSMYAFFGFSGFIEILNLYKITHFSREAEYTLLALAFGVEGTLFAFHLHGRNMFDVRIHTLLYIVIYLSALVILLEACLVRFRRELFIARTVFTLTQGSWFWEIAYTLYGSKRWFVDADKDLTEKQLMMDTEFITVAIMWHLFGWIMLVLFCCVVSNCLYKRMKFPSCCASHEKNEQRSSLMNEKVFLENNISDEEEILLKQEDKSSFALLSNNNDLP